MREGPFNINCAIMELGPQNHTKDGLLRPNSIMVGKTDPQTRGSSRFRAWGELRGLGLEAFKTSGLLCVRLPGSRSVQVPGLRVNPKLLNLVCRVTKFASAPAEAVRGSYTD